MNAQEGLSRVWAVDDGEKVRQDDVNHWAAAGANNDIWDGQAIRLFGSRNEFVAFQLILEAGALGAKNVTVELDSLSGDGGVIKNTGGFSDPYDFVGKRIEMFVGQYLDVPERSSWDGTWGYWGARAQPDADFIGRIPDALVPFESPAGERDHGQGGAPFRISPTSSQTVWLDLFIPKGQAPGMYTGSVRVREGDVIKYTIPIFLRVYDATLPDETHVRNFFAFGRALLEMHPGIQDGTPEFYDLLHRYMNLAHRHRVNLADGQREIDNFIQNLSGYYTGAHYTPANRYEGPGQGVGETIYSIGTYDQPTHGFLSGYDPPTQEVWQAASDRWEGWFSQNAPSVLRFKYMIDEPSLADYPTIIERASWIVNNPGIGKNLRVFCAGRMHPDLFGSVNVWAVTGQPGYFGPAAMSSGYVLARAAERRALGEMVGLYNGSRPSYGQASALDNPATDNRVNPWIMWKYGVDFYYLFDVAAFAYLKTNAWANQKSVIEGSVLWGDGYWIYSGEDKVFPGDSRGLRGPIASIRMKNWRRGVQDYEYLWLAKQAGLDTRAVVDRIVPRALDDFGDSYTGSSVPPMWAQHGYQFERARRDLANLLTSSAGKLTAPVGALHVTPDVLPPEGGDVRLTWTIEGSDGGTIDGGVGQVAVTGSSTVRVTKTTTFTMSASNGAGTTIARAKVYVGPTVPNRGTNTLLNPGFDSGTDGWLLRTDGTASFGSVTPGYQSSAAARISVTEMKGTLSLSQRDVPLTKADTYRLSFAARAVNGGAVDVSISRQTPPYSSYGLAGRTVTLTSDWAVYALDFTTVNIADSVNDAVLTLDMSGHATSGSEYLFDTVELKKIATTPPPPPPPPTSSIPTDFGLDQNYPNPFNPVTRIQYALPIEAFVQLRVFNMLGEEVLTLVNSVIAAGRHTVDFDASRLSAGVYLYRFQAGDFVESRKMILLK